MAILWRTVLAPIAAAAMLGGCADTAPLARLPDITSLPKVLSKEEQQGKVDAMIENGQKAGAAREIEKSR